MTADEFIKLLRADIQEGLGPDEAEARCIAYTLDFDENDETERDKVTKYLEEGLPREHFGLDDSPGTDEPYDSESELPDEELRRLIERLESRIGDPSSYGEDFFNVLREAWKLAPNQESILELMETVEEKGSSSARDSLRSILLDEKLPLPPRATRLLGRLSPETKQGQRADSDAYELLRLARKHFATGTPWDLDQAKRLCESIQSDPECGDSAKSLLAAIEQRLDIPHEFDDLFFNLNSDIRTKKWPSIATWWDKVNQVAANLNIPVPSALKAQWRLADGIRQGWETLDEAANLRRKGDFANAQGFLAAARELESNFGGELIKQINAENELCNSLETARLELEQLCSTI